MTVADYIRDKFRKFDIILSESDLLEMSLSSGINGEDELTSENIGLVSVSMVGFIPSLLLRATSKSVSENGHSKSQSWDVSGIKEYYAFLCKKYGLNDELNADKPKVKFL